MEALRGFKDMVITINSNPIGTRILGYLMLIVLLVVLVLSTVVVAVMAWGIVESLLSGHIPSVNEDSEWGLR